MAVIVATSQAEHIGQLPAQCSSTSTAWAMSSSSSRVQLSYVLRLCRDRSRGHACALLHFIRTDKSR